jgi:GxxExxY protein
MEVIFGVHREYGRLFDESVYHKEIARRLSNARIQVPLDLSFDHFRKRYYLDLLYSDGAVLELKANETVIDRHRAQLINYLLILELPHGKLVNLRTQSVQHEFVNAPLTRNDRTSFIVERRDFRDIESGRIRYLDLLVSILRDWGTCLEVSLYEDAITHFLGGEEKVLQPVKVLAGDTTIGVQLLRLISPEVAFKITAFERDLPQYEQELLRLLQHTPLRYLQWANIGRRTVTFKTLSKT